MSILETNVKTTQRPMRRLLLLAMTLATTGLTQAQSGVIRMVVPFPAGGVTDQAARILSEHMGKQLGQTIVIENRPGAGSRLGVDAVIKATPDGNTLLFTNTSYSILPVVDPKVSFDPATALVPVSLTASYGLQVVTRNSTPANTLTEFIAHAKKNPGKLSYGSAGVGSGAHFAGEYFKHLTGTYIVHIPYRSTSGAVTDVAGDLLDLAFDAAAKPLIDSGRVKLLAVTARKRDPRFPNTPTAAEVGLKAFIMESWVGLLAPPATPPAALERLNKAASSALADATVQKRLAELGLQPEGGPANRFASAIRDDIGLYGKIARDAKLQFE